VAGAHPRGLVADRGRRRGPGQGSRRAPAGPIPSAFDPDRFVPATISAAALLKPFAYDRSAPLHLTTIDSKVTDGSTVSHVEFDVAGGAAVRAELVVPRHRSGRAPAVIFAHGGAPDPKAFRSEALELGRHGLASIAPDLPITMTGNVETDIVFVRRAIIIERRALDVLVARPDVDAGRIGFVGHSWGADLAAIMAGAEPRLAAVVIACGWSRMATDMYAIGRPADGATYMTAASALDGFRFVAIKRARAS
jgi:acetyl esterase/lipase